MSHSEKKIFLSLKQAAEKIYKELENFLLSQGSTRRRNDDFLFARAEIHGHSFILLRIDDIIVTSKSLTVISDVN